jgi:DNA-binding XRE family transcriptional regulator
MDWKKKKEKRKHPTPQIKINIEGSVSHRLLKVLKEDFGDKVVIEDDAFELAQNMDWHKRTSAKMTAGDHMKAYRMSRGLTQIQLGEALDGISKQNISGMENGRRTIGKEVAKKLAEIFNISVEKFL